jgi:hypothetical protein
VQMPVPTVQRTEMQYIMAHFQVSTRFIAAYMFSVRSRIRNSGLGHRFDQELPKWVERW